MDAETYTDLIPLIFLGLVFFIVAISALYWTAKKGQLRDFNSQAKTIFTHEEPEGEISDAFPGEKNEED
ncbi:MAG: cbb3-type cytochrome oxidase assembly protein CcoS [Puniceicoccaceae bacterium]|nr:MAG: cbb3-type cytochrome oxidase assembly protein CcoS [Puniceicoccaceae bacterium]|tara:strand:- start:266 stop:472 length:207 start_codon:yes stop_codon:yes gene_type:complete